MNEATADGDGVLARFAAELARAAGAATLAGAEPRRESRALLLRLARDVAHATERQNAPLVTYLVGRYVELRAREGVAERDALEEAETALQRFTGSERP
jgi:Domain of unknown function (DUF6457)